MTLSGELTTFLAVLGLEQGDERILDAIALVDLPTDEQGYLRDDGTTVDYLSMRPSGTDFAFTNGVLSSISIRTQSMPDYGVYPRPDSLIDGLDSTATREEVAALLGAPERSGPAWDRYPSDDHFLHFEYREGRIALVTVMGKAP